MRLAERLLEMSKGVELDLRELARAAWYIDQLEARMAQLEAKLAAAEAPKDEVMDVEYYDNLLRPIKSLDEHQRRKLAEEYASKQTGDQHGQA